MFASWERSVTEERFSVDDDRCPRGDQILDNLPNRLANLPQAVDINQTGLEPRLVSSGSHTCLASQRQPQQDESTCRRLNCTGEMCDLQGGRCPIPQTSRRRMPPRSRCTEGERARMAGAPKGHK